MKLKNSPLHICRHTHPHCKPSLFPSSWIHCGFQPSEHQGARLYYGIWGPLSPTLILSQVVLDFEPFEEHSLANELFPDHRFLHSHGIIKASVPLRVPSSSLSRVWAYGLWISQSLCASHSAPAASFLTISQDIRACVSGPAGGTMHSTGSHVLSYSSKPVRLRFLSAKAYVHLPQWHRMFRSGVRDLQMPRKDPSVFTCPIPAQNWKWPQFWLIAALSLPSSPSYIAPWI